MADLASALKDTPLPTIFVVAGIVFWLLAIAGSIAGKITVLPGQQKTAGVVGTLFVVLGMMLYLVPGTMVPQGGAKILNLGAGDFESVSPAQLQKLEYSMVPIPGDDDNSNRLVSGDIFAVLTRSGNHSKVQVLSYGYNLQIQWITYQTIADH